MKLLEWEVVKITFAIVEWFVKKIFLSLHLGNLGSNLPAINIFQNEKCLGLKHFQIMDKKPEDDLLYPSGHKDTE